MPPEPTAKVEDSPAAVPVVFWLSVGKVQLAKLPEAGVPSAGATNVLLDSVWEPVRVATVESIAMVTADEPL